MTEPIACVVDGDRILWRCEAHVREAHWIPGLEDKLCANVATREASWFGRNVKLCNGCHARASKVADVFGFELPSKTLDVPHPGTDDAEIRFSLMELE